FFARYAGDEFVALVSLSEEQCDAVKLRIRRAVDQVSFCVRPTKYVRVGVSIGCAQYGTDRAMYENKHNRKTRSETDCGNIVFIPNAKEVITVSPAEGVLQAPSEGEMPGSSSEIRLVPAYSSSELVPSYSATELAPASSDRTETALEPVFSSVGKS